MEEIGVGLELNEPAGLGTAEVSVDSVLGLEEPLEDTIGLELEQPIALNAGEDAVASALSLENPRSEVEEVGAGLELDESDEIENSDPQLAEPTDLELPPTCLSYTLLSPSDSTRPRLPSPAPSYTC